MILFFVIAYNLVWPVILILAGALVVGVTWLVRHENQ